MTDADEFIRAVEARLRDVIGEAPIAAPAVRFLDAGGKRLRARLVWWAAVAGGRPLAGDAMDRLTCAAATIELAHLGSLVHDDIVDGALTRRGVTTLHCTHGVRRATDIGVAIAHLANARAASLGRRARRCVRRGLLATCRGQIRELALPYVRTSPHARLAVMREKTGAFFQLAADLGAILGGADAASRAAIGRFARRFGVAFQIADDVLDLSGDPAVLGRTNGADLRDGVFTLPVLLAADPEGRLAVELDRVRRTGSADAVAAAAARVIAGGGIAAARAAAAWWLSRALAALTPLPDPRARAELGDLARRNVRRGLQPGVPRFTADRPPLTAAPPPAAPFAALHPLPGNAALRLSPRLAHVLDWFHPGLAALTAARADAVAERRRRLEQRLCRGRQWSPPARLAAEAIALAHALVDGSRLEADPTWTLALIDALHCAAIGFLASAPTADEHARMAARARRLMETDRADAERACALARSRAAPALPALPSPA
ncbi:MAG: hypothetical protein B6D46_14390 [Polyangiaceae bacterium UTPRO1]|jgi:heptaprenyl diphosphate synthase|nr:polyprenyl synthetase family protein [Myxococcales bacterium]OQY65296.1 MAG: hypothetical protein B6D46_14390 [Polyangiaceae bacterium UTPRO1]